MKQAKTQGVPRLIRKTAEALRRRDFEKARRARDELALRRVVLLLGDELPRRKEHV
jgi:hypothetical protein